MSWRYEQSSGRMLDAAGALLAVGYTGHGQGVDDPALQSEPDVGPIPQGRYSIGPAQTHPHLGPLAMALTPASGTDTFGRSGFFIHGDNAALDHSASHGCIVLARPAREAIAASADRALEVVA